jgi:hypothetical protein
MPASHCARGCTGAGVRKAEGGNIVLERDAARVFDAVYPLCDQRIDIARTVIAVLGQVTEEIQIGFAPLQQLARYGVHLGKAVIAQDDVEIGVDVDQRTRHIVERDVKFSLVSRQTLLGLLQLCDVGSRRDRPAHRDAAAQYAVDGAVWGIVLERDAARVFDAVYPLCDQRIDIARTVIAVLGQVAEEIQIGFAPLQQLARHGVHLGKAVIT